eukprot:CAMPEP_0168350138 /NCGR_PEP_ID=MMETSP0213-20121227/20913_1 /TAXON_ID=151035 /ORGANISM="Euplotes harpa, Strain FSP1.4" /LENGTH=58 /DNA_ID=CAMNT_0008360373 /DNA_START=85 /DNA_END=258 /DNA_ORIENTATION=-
MYNEDFDLLMLTMAGVYRTYFELVRIDEGFKDRVAVVIVSDGVDKLDSNFKKRAKKIG